MRILVFNWKDLRHPAAGGAEVYTHELLRRWAGEHQVTWFAAASPGLPAEELIDDVRVVRSGDRRSVYRAARRFYRQEMRGRVDLVVDEVNTRPFGCIRWVPDAPVVALIHQVAREIWFRETRFPVALLGRFVLEPYWLRAYAEAPVLTVSASSRDSLLRYGLRVVTVVPEGVQSCTRPQDVPREARPTLIFVGRLTASKRPADALQAFRLVRRELPQAQLWMVGDGPRRPALEREAPAGTVFWGRVPHETKQQLMARAHVLVVTSVREGWGLVVDEAAAMGTVTVGYDVPGLRDSVPAARGLLTAPNPRALAATVRAALPRLVSAPTDGWAGGARSWDEVATVVLEAARRGAASWPRRPRQAAGSRPARGGAP
jgi:glycosyltransferase involved in cell wall biosynthesis